MKLLDQIDRAADGVLMMGALTSGIASIKPGNTSKTPRHSSTARKAYHGLLGAATVYKLVRAIAPKTKEERRVEKLAQVYDQAEQYSRRARAYRKIAESFLKRRLGEVKAATAASSYSLK